MFNSGLHILDTDVTRLQNERDKHTVVLLLHDNKNLIL